MLERPFANTETLRLADIHSLAIFYTPLDARFDRLTRLAQKALNVPVAAIALNHQGKLWFKSVQGWNIHELDLKESFCARTLTKGEPVIVEDTRLDPEFAHHKLVESRAQVPLLRRLPDPRPQPAWSSARSRCTTARRGS